MPSPFPGMDPYLESPDWFPDLHDGLIFCLKESLQNLLPESYYAQSSQRIWMEYSRHYVEPDVEVVSARKKSKKRGRGGVAVAAHQTAEPVVVMVESVEHGPFEESYLEIRRRKGKEVRLVASIEILSLSNKSPGNPGREQYLTKQKEILGGPVHLVEIDLLRGGTHTTAVPRELIEAKVGPFDYHVSVRRFDRPTAFLVYPLSMRLRLPPLAIPLLPGDPDVTVDLQAVFDRAYDAGPYRRKVDYGEDPVIPPFRPDQAKWVASQLIRPR
ncbi:MAG: DUF4058 family protein [Isosphaeraceae bacterium]